MEEYDRLVERQRKWMLYLLVVFLIGVMITPYDRLFLSLLIGYVVGYYSLRILQSRIRAFGEKILQKGSGGSLGTLIRMGGIGIIVLIALRFPEKIHISSFGLGFGIVYIVLFVDFAFQQLRDDRRKNR